MPFSTGRYGVLPMSLQPTASDAASSGVQSHKDKKSKSVKKQTSKEFIESAASAPALEDVEKSIMQEVTRYFLLTGADDSLTCKAYKNCHVF